MGGPGLRSSPSKTLSCPGWAISSPMRTSTPRECASRTQTLSATFWEALDCAPDCARLCAGGCIPQGACLAALMSRSEGVPCPAAISRPQVEVYSHTVVVSSMAVLSQVGIRKCCAVLALWRLSQPNLWGTNLWGLCNVRCAPHNRDCMCAYFMAGPAREVPRQPSNRCRHARFDTLHEGQV